MREHSHFRKFIDLLFKLKSKTPLEKLAIIKNIARCGFLRLIISIMLMGLAINTSYSLTSEYSQFLPDLGDSDRTNLSQQDATFLGQQIIQQIANRGDMLVDYDLNAYLNSLGGELVSFSSLATIQPFKFYAVKGKEINAFALPGGFICIYNGLIYTTDSEAELSGVMAHEIGHIVQHHIFRNISVYNRNQWLALAGVLTGALLAPINPGAAIVAASSGQGLAIQNILSFSRDFEREADRVGQEIMYNAGFDAHAMPAFFGKLNSVNKFNNNDALAFLQTHPVTLERLSEAELRANTLSAKMKPDSKTFLMMREKCRVRQLGIASAINYYQQALKTKRYVDINVIYYGLAFTYLSNDSPSNALLYLNKISDNTISNHPAFYSLKAQAYGKMNNYKASSKVYDQALSIYPDYKGLWIGKVDTEIGAKQYKKAASELHELSIKYPNDTDIWTRIAFIYSDANLNNQQIYLYAVGNQQYILGNLKMALAKYQQAIKVASKKSDDTLNNIIISKIVDTQPRIKANAKYGK
ncbi:MAG: M48 family metalloprotease [Neisseriaceae bacterium]